MAGSGGGLSGPQVAGPTNFGELVPVITDLRAVADRLDHLRSARGRSDFPAPPHSPTPRRVCVIDEAPL